MRKISRKRKPNAVNMLLFVITMFFIVACIVILVLIYGTKTLTWSQLYSTFALSQPTQQPIENIETDTAPMEYTIDENSVAISIIDVGQGDSILIEAGKTVILVDAGEWSAAPKIENYLKNRNISTIDYLVATHPHTDHIGGMRMLLDAFEVKNMLFTTHSLELTPINTTYERFIKALYDKDIPTRTASTLEILETEKGTLTVLSAGGYNDLNECSIVLQFVYGQNSFLLMGDAGFTVEKDLIKSGYDLKSDVLKAGHHGSKYATDSSFLKEVNPKFTVASCGVDNQYGYPTDAFVQRVLEINSTLLRTDIDKDVVFISDGANITLITGKQEQDKAA